MGENCNIWNKGTKRILSVVINIGLSNVNEHCVIASLKLGRVVGFFQCLFLSSRIWRPHAFGGDYPQMGS